MWPLHSPSSTPTRMASSHFKYVTRMKGTGGIEEDSGVERRESEYRKINSVMQEVTAAFRRLSPKTSDEDFKHAYEWAVKHSASGM